MLLTSICWIASRQVYSCVICSVLTSLMTSRYWTAFACQTVPMVNKTWKWTFAQEHQNSCDQNHELINVQKNYKTFEMKVCHTVCFSGCHTTSQILIHAKSHTGVAENNCFEPHCTSIGLPKCNIWPLTKQKPINAKLAQLRVPSWVNNQLNILWLAQGVMFAHTGSEAVDWDFSYEALAKLSHQDLETGRLCQLHFNYRNIWEKSAC